MDLPKTEGIDPRLQAAGLMAFAGQPQLAWEMLSDFRRRTVGKLVLKSLKEAGFPLSDPSGVVLSSLLSSGAVTVDEAFQVYLQLKEAQAADLQAALRLREIEKTSLEARKLQAEILRTEVQTAQDLANLYYDEPIKSIEAELEAIRQYKRDLVGLNYNQQKNLIDAGINPADELRRLEIREKALLQASAIQARKKQRFIFHLTNKLRAGQPTALTAPEAMAKEELKNLGLAELAQKGQEAFRDSELEVDEYFINLAETTAQIDIAKKRHLTGISREELARMPAGERAVVGKAIQKEIEEGIALQREFVDVLATHVGPGYAVYFDRAYRKSLSNYMPTYLPDTFDTEPERSFWDDFTKFALGVGASVLAGAAALRYGPKILSKLRRRRPKALPSPKESPGPIQDVVEEAKQKALKAGVKLPELPAPARSPKGLPAPESPPALPGPSPKGLPQPTLSQPTTFPILTRPPAPAPKPKPKRTKKSSPRAKSRTKKTAKTRTKKTQSKGRRKKK